jgi:hypothetical protein
MALRLAWTLTMNILQPALLGSNFLLSLLWILSAPLSPTVPEGNCTKPRAVGDRIDVICDGGITRGTHVLKALSGAKSRAVLAPLMRISSSSIEASRAAMSSRRLVSPSMRSVRKSGSSTASWSRSVCLASSSWLSAKRGSRFASAFSNSCFPALYNPRDLALIRRTCHREIATSIARTSENPRDASG